MAGSQDGANRAGPARADTSRTAVDRPFAGRTRRFQLRIGEIGELERLCGAGIGAIQLRLAGHQFRFADIREAVRLGLEGGGASEPEATGLVMRYVDRAPIAEHIQLAADILSACIAGVPEPEDEDPPGKPTAERTDPATSPPSTAPAAPQD